MRNIKFGLTGLVISILFVGFVTIAYTADTHHDHHSQASESQMTMKEVMQNLGVELEKITAAIILQDYTAIEQSAKHIANHTPPSMAELERIFSILGEDAEAFKVCDLAVHNLATELAVFATKQEMESILDTYHAMIVKTVECHAGFRNKVVGDTPASP